ncbi:MAG: LON peptidase substrate-binding domain-containing protein [Xanthomonadales bacterium]|nr:LON peptidase substrate-binding domain-containing protein [Xanthomonadales bacterium]
MTQTARATNAPTGDLPLFPLHGVLFPGGEMRLRLFEPRYLDLVSDCSRRDSGFGVCLIVQGEEAGEPALPAAWGTRARITDFYTLDDGLLGITVRGGRRFHVRRTRLRDNGLIVGDVEWCLAEHADEPLRPQHGLLATLLSRLLEADAEEAGSEKAGSGDAAPIPGFDPQRLDDPVWVGFRMAERLPLEPNERQALLQMDDPHARLDRLLEWLPRFSSA